MKLLTILLTAFLLHVSADWNLDFEKAKSEASQGHKYILLNFSGSDWCAPCIKLKKDIFEADAFKAYATDHLVLVRADFPRSKKNQLDKAQTARNEALAETYNTQGKFPLTLLLDANGKVVKVWDGYVDKTPEAFVTELDGATRAAN
ncbi:thioredoxin family protein [Arsenicibacter rosenii]|uniref:Thiol-disulfide isomerase n=1 Tax=Arsenicibacter rosenii TaxID=1750698 RepID=A0A1S2VEE2_9BACT|nr:thioredoxin family protein [Arsenicibacter rosenii]OIN56278.1 thiol-disulfide isomerase [Arsenicibacter rosenii]